MRHLTEAEIEKELQPNFSAQVYQDPRTRGLFTLKRREGGKVVIGGASGFYSEAITSLGRYSVSEEYFSNFLPIAKESKKLEQDSLLSHPALKVKGWDCVKDDYIIKAVLNSNQFEYLEETNQLAKANSIRLGYY